MSGQPERFTFFWGHTAKSRYPCFSQWYARDFMVDGVTFARCEQWMMWSKAVLFGDRAAAAAIMASTDPRQDKALGRGVRGFDDAAWTAEAPGIVRRGNLEKFAQHADLRQVLAATRDTTLVEASPYDRIWGIGLGASDPRALSRATWLGQNLLGEAETSVRIELCGS